MQHRLISGLALAAALAFALPHGHGAFAAGPCADPANNCPNNGQVTFGQGSSTGTGGASGINTASGADTGTASLSSTSVSVDPTTAPIGATVTVTGQGFAPNGRPGAVFINLVTPDGNRVEMRRSGDPIVQAGSDGSFSARVTVPDRASQGSQQVCVESVVAPRACTAFTVSGGSASAAGSQDDQQATSNPTSIAGHYQCSSKLLVGFGSMWCDGTEPVLALYDDGSYDFGDSSGTYSYDGSTVSFDDGSVTATVQNRLLTITLPTDTGTVVLKYIRMNY